VSTYDDGIPLATKIETSGYTLTRESPYLEFDLNSTRTSITATTQTHTITNVTSDVTDVPSAVTVYKWQLSDAGENEDTYEIYGYDASGFQTLYETHTSSSVSRKVYTRVPLKANLFLSKYEAFDFTENAWKRTSHNNFTTEYQATPQWWLVTESIYNDNGQKITGGGNSYYVNAYKEGWVRPPVQPFSE
jgi:hypothetical protein